MGKSLTWDVIGQPILHMVLFCGTLYFKNTDFQYIPVAFHMLSMSIIVVLRSEDPVKDVMRCTGGSIILGVIDDFCVKSQNLFGVILRVFVIYCVIANGEYMVHRFILHAHWSTRAMGYNIFTRIFTAPIFFHYAHHYLAHHYYCRDPEISRKLKYRHPNPVSNEKKNKLESKYPLAKSALQCSDHGITINSWFCVLGLVFAFLMLMPGAVIHILLLNERWFGSLMVLLTLAIPIYLSIEHQNFHSTEEETKQWADKQILLVKWLWTSNAMKKMIKNHKLHHEKKIEKFFGAMPYSKEFVFPIWQNY